MKTAAKDDNCRGNDDFFLLSTASTFSSQKVFVLGIPPLMNHPCSAFCEGWMFGTYVFPPSV
jgi:hypothetical protein